MRSAIKGAAINSARKHYWLMAGTVLAVDNENNARISANLNTILTTDRQVVRQKDLGQTQQLMQMRFWKENFPEEIPSNLKVVDVFILSASYLGHMTADEFQKGMDHPAPAIPPAMN